MKRGLLQTLRDKTARQARWLRENVGCRYLGRHHWVHTWRSTRGRHRRCGTCGEIQTEIA